MSTDMRYRTGRHDALQGNAMVAVHGEEYEAGWRAGRLEALANDIKRSKNLQQLHRALVAFEVAQEEDVAFECSPCADNTEGALASHGIDICELPTFGGPEPNSKIELWSWDEDSLLMGVGPFTDWEIVDRKEQKDNT